MEGAKPSKFLIFGGTGYIGKYLVEASVSMGHQAYVYARPVSSLTADANLKLRDRFRSLGVTIVEGTMDEHEKMVSTMKEVDVVISALAYPQVFDQFKIIDAIIAAGNVKRFLPSDFGCDEDRVRPLPPFGEFLGKKRKIRRVIEQGSIPFTYISANCFGAYFINLLLHPHDPQRDHVLIFGNGEAKVVFNYEEDIAKYSIKVALDPRTCNRVVVYRPRKNIISQLDLITLWEKKTGRRFRRVFVHEEELVRLSKALPDPDNIQISIVHSVFVRGDTVGFELGDNDIEASGLYPDMEFISVDEILEIFQGPGAPLPAMAAFK